MGILFSLFAKPLGWLLHWIYTLVPSYFIAILLFTLLVRVVLFPLNIKTQKSSADRARLAPRLERIQKKYANDRQKLAQKQQELYEKEGVSMTGGCLPAIAQMLVLFSIIAVIYKPLTYVQRMPEADINTCVTAVEEELKTELGADSKEFKSLSSRLTEKSYYRELYLLKYTDQYGDQMKSALLTAGKDAAAADETVALLGKTQKEFSIFGISLLGVATDTGLKPNWLWLLAILSGVSALLSSLLSMKYSKATMPAGQDQAAGCSTNGMMYMMPLVSLIFSFTVPGGVVVYWIFSNLLAMVQTVILNAMYNPAKIREQAELEYAERRRKKAEDRERLKQARLEEQAAWQREENEKKAAQAGKKPVKKPAAPAEDAEDTVTEAAQEAAESAKTAEDALTD